MKTRDEMLDEIWEFYYKYDNWIESFKGDKFYCEYHNIQLNKED